MTDNAKKILLFGAWFIVIILLTLAMLAQADTAQAAPSMQTTPTPLPTADIDYVIELSSGNEFAVERSVNYGQIGIIAAVGIAVVMIVLIGAIFLVLHFLR